MVQSRKTRADRETLVSSVPREDARETKSRKRNEAAGPGDNGPAEAPAVFPARENGRKHDIFAAAERLFSEAPYEAVSIRDVAAAAGVNSALIRYHFGTKEELYRRLFSDRYHLITGRRVAALAELAIVPGSAASVAGIVECWVRPLVELASKRDSKHFIALLAREAGDATADARSIVSGHLDPSVEVCLRALRQALPGVGDALIIQGYLWMIAATMSTITAAGRAKRLAGRAPMPRRPDALLAPLVAFITGGLLAIAPAAASPG